MWQRVLRFRNSQQIAPYLFVAPFIISFILFFSYPLFQAFLMSFQKVLPEQVTFVGLDNFKRLNNPSFYKALYNNFRYTVYTILILIPIPLVLAVFLNSKIMRFKNLFRSALFIPALTSVAVAGIIFRLIFSELDGALMNTIVQWFGFESQKWLYHSSTGMFALVMIAAWRWMGINILYFLSALQNIPPELYEAADIDGAGWFNKFFRVTIPMLRPITIYVLTISIYGGFAMFTESYMLWGSRGSPQDIGLTMVGYIYQQGFQYFDLGFGSAIGLVLLFITLGVSLIQLRFMGLFGKED